MAYYIFILFCLISTSKGDVLSGLNAFSNGLYDVLPKQNDNLVFSPFSVHAALSLAYQGAAGSTASSLQSALNVQSPEHTAREYRSVSNKLRDVKNVTIDVANKIYVKNKFRLRRDFLIRIRDFGLVEVQNINFLNRRAAADEINAWVRSQTNSRIDELVSEEDFDEFTRAVILNAVYFKGPWLRKFDEAKTKPEKFFISDREFSSCHMMHQVDEFYYTDLPELNAQMVELRYLDRRFNMYVVLPNSKTGIRELERALVSTDISVLTDRLYGTTVNLSLPRFRIQSSLELREPLKKVGFRRIFSDYAEFPYMIDSSEPLKINDVMQKAFIEVNEEGSKATAATGVIVAIPISFNYEPPPPVEFKADHPFVFFITVNLSDDFRAKSENVVLFMGKLNAPV